MKSPIGSTDKFSSGKMGSKIQSEANATIGDRVFRHHHTSTPVGNAMPTSGSTT